MKVLKFITGNLKMISIIGVIVSLITLLIGGWWLIVPALVIGLQAFLFIKVYARKKFKPADWNYWYPSAEWIKAAVPVMYVSLRVTGYAKADYRADRNDCDDYVDAGIVALHGLFMKETPDDLKAAFAIFRFSFRRDDGKRHRLIQIIDNDGYEYFIENYPVFDGYHDKSGMYRTLSVAERMNGEKV